MWVLRDGFLTWFGQRCREGILKVVWWLDFWWWKIYGESFFLSGSGLTCDDASNGSVFALIPKLTQDNQNKIEIAEK